MNTQGCQKSYPISLHDPDGNSTVPERFGRITSLVGAGYNRIISSEKVTLPQIVDALGNPIILDVSERPSLDFITEIGQGYTGILQLIHGKKWAIEDLITSVGKGWSGLHRVNGEYFKVFHTGSRLFHGRTDMLYYLIHSPAPIPLDPASLVLQQRSQPDWVRDIHKIL